MAARNPGDPLSWTFQWYVHAIPTNTSKAKALAQYFPAPSPAGQLAQAAWDTCEPHFSDIENNFLPWHRMYVARFEAIIQAVSNRPDFTLPYWDYTAPGAARALPAAFLKKDDPVWGSLWRDSRRPNSNQGKPIDGWPGGYPLNLDSMRSVRYGDDGADAGFCANLDGGLHGNVHGDVGNGVGMGSVPWAANDPVFWIHHCNIDRVWASWNKAGGKNLDDAAFLAQTFPFADASGARVDMQVADVMQTVQVGYTYDSYLPRPAGSPPFPVSKPGGFTAVPQASTNAVSGPVDLGAGASTTVTLSSGNAAGFGAKDFAAQIKALTPKQTVYLRLTGLQASSHMTGGYDVYLNLPQGQAASRTSPAYVGTVNFFGAGAHDHGAMSSGMAAPKGRTISFRITAAAKRAAVDGKAGHSSSTIATSEPRLR